MKENQTQVKGQVIVEDRSVMESILRKKELSLSLNRQKEEAKTKMNLLAWI